eukprot:15066937-Alexandrium_andersonii.AAC.1
MTRSILVMQGCSVRICASVMPIHAWQLNCNIVSHRNAVNDTRVGGSILGLARTCFPIMPYAFV